MKTISSDYKFKSDDEIEADRLCDKARAAAISFIGINNKTSLKVSGWLLGKGYPDSIVKRVVAELLDDGTINDEAYAKAVLKSRTGTRTESAAMSLIRLKRLGVPALTAQKCVRSFFENEKKENIDSINLLRLKFSSKMDTMHEWTSDERLKFQHKCYRFLLGRGYSMEKSYLATKTLMKEDYLNEE
jgi:SOS response regulatory protein OraA/RecX